MAVIIGSVSSDFLSSGVHSITHAMKYTIQQEVSIVRLWGG
jgi:hypothetical protein